MEMKPTDAQIIAARFPNASKSTRAANQLPKTQHGTGVVSPAVAAPVNSGGSGGGKAKRTMSAPALNKTEQRWQSCHPEQKPFPMSLRWGKSMRYSPDFLDENPCHRPRLIEVKGAHIYDRDIVRFKGCAAEWGWLFQFEMWMWKDRKWTRIY